MIELDDLCDCLCTSQETRIERRVRRRCEVQQGYALGAVGAASLVAPDAMVGAALTNCKARIGSAPSHGSTEVECEERRKGNPNRRFGRAIVQLDFHPPSAYEPSAAGRLCFRGTGRRLRACSLS